MGAGWRVFRMDIDGVGAAVDLGGAEFNEMQEFVFEAAVLEMSFQREHGLQRVGGVFVVRDAGLHKDCSPFFVVAGGDLFSGGGRKNSTIVEIGMQERRTAL